MKIIMKNNEKWKMTIMKIVNSNEIMVIMKVMKMIVI